MPRKLDVVLRIVLAGLGIAATGLSTLFCIQIYQAKNGWGVLGFVSLVTPVAVGISLAWVINSLVGFLRVRSRQTSVLLFLSLLSLAVIIVESIVLMSTPMSGN